MQVIRKHDEPGFISLKIPLIMFYDIEETILAMLFSLKTWSYLFIIFGLLFDECATFKRDGKLCAGFLNMDHPLTVNANYSLLPF